MIDWTIATPGAIAVHRNGGRSFISRIQESQVVGCKRVWFKEMKAGAGHMLYENDGQYSPLSMLDIIAIQPAPKPVQVNLYGGADLVFSENQYGEDTHTITLNLIDGQPDCDSVKMERIND